MGRHCRMNSLPLFQDRSTSCGKRNRVLLIASAYAEIEKAEAPLLIATHASLQSADIGAAVTRKTLSYAAKSASNVREKPKIKTAPSGAAL